MYVRFCVILTECDLIFPASVMNGVAVSKTFQILYRNEDVSVDDIILFKVQMLVDTQKVRHKYNVNIPTKHMT